MPYVRDSFWRGRDFASLPEMRAAALVWCTDLAGPRACRPLDTAVRRGVVAGPAVLDTITTTSTDTAATARSCSGDAS